MRDSPTAHTLTRDGHELAFTTWGEGPMPILAIHGITATSRHFAVLADALRDRLGDQHTLIAPDLRGRGNSRGLVGPYGMATHAGDAVAILDHLGLPSATVIGHSMGGFVAAVMATDAPDRVSHVILADGGVDLGLPVPDDVEATVTAVVGPALERLGRTFDGPQDYLDFWHAHPALVDCDSWDPHLTDAVTYDLWSDDEGWHPTPVREQILGDAADMLTDEATRTAADRITIPLTLLWCARGLLGVEPGLYPPAIAGGFPERFPTATVAEVPDSNHYTMLLSTTGAGQVADHVASAVHEHAART